MRLQGKVWLLLVLAASAGAYWWQSGSAEQPVAEGVFAPSLRQTSVDGLPPVPVSGKMDAKQLKALFDYYLATQGERTLPEIRQEIEKQLAARLSGKDLQDAQDFFHRYLAYLNDLGQAGKIISPVSADVVSQMSQRLQLLRQIRARHFTPQELKQLFASSDAMDELVLQRMAIQRRQDLSEAEKRRHLDELEQSLQPEQRAARLQTIQHIALADAERSLRQKGGTPEQLQALRAEMVGVEAAQRLAAVDAEVVVWQTKLQQWKQEREQLTKDEALSGPQRQQAFQALEQKLFSENERKRLLAYQ
jgi:lipase chaperone LimK